jgi:hypothetical protein
MKKILFIGMATIALLSAGCKTRYTEIATVLDYSQYTKDGFFLSESDAVSFEYESIGRINAEVISGEDRSAKKNQGFYSARVATEDDIIRVLCEKAKSLGADGLINVKSVHYVKNSIWTGSGMAIKRKQF